MSFCRPSPDMWWYILYIVERYDLQCPSSVYTVYISSLCLVYSHTHTHTCIHTWYDVHASGRKWGVEHRSVIGCVDMHRVRCDYVCDRWYTWPWLGIRYIWYVGQKRKVKKRPPLFLLPGIHALYHIYVCSAMMCVPSHALLWIWLKIQTKAVKLQVIIDLCTVMLIHPPHIVCDRSSEYDNSVYKCVCDSRPKAFAMANYHICTMVVECGLCPPPSISAFRCWWWDIYGYLLIIMNEKDEVLVERMDERTERTQWTDVHHISQHWIADTMYEPNGTIYT